MSKTTKAVAKKQVKTKASTKKGTAKKSISTSYVYAFGKKTDGNATMRDLLGGKGANLAEMASIGLPVPPGFTISTEVCGYYYDNGKTYPASLSKSVLKAIK
ncbi:MAG: pyruvate, phosphate dikinase, partial [OM182 bacterium]|nr:pyruvate, phosphate dikinase [OM182 bacterium]